MPFIRSQLEGERLDTERVEPQQFITIREGERIIACGRIKPYEMTFELGSVWVAEDRRGPGTGAQITREPGQPLPPGHVQFTTDPGRGRAPQFEPAGFRPAKEPSRQR